ncbi:hypothetical protein A2108_00695 [Candidatus Wolfebacteria bacterium GWA1_42_9]|uniref:Glycosyltransferase 2-like domain-containing protein n=1 Tax=Candidatus Wolfebacteria bacterium GWA1_42_9 TaxID=1802553 RepID=A0A1F8DN70_9BACT|nr:MAG: hypothetical protein A2108_00695 [Candidatus Wolfebacteria bacterium GWA1_42_9]
MKLSVVMSVYNGERFLREALESILSQTFADFEFIIINDGSKDGSLGIIKKHPDPRMKVISRENRGLIYSLNEGIGSAQGEYIARMDADDISLPNRLEEQVRFLDDHPDVWLCGSWAELIDEKGEKQGELKTPIGVRNVKKSFFWHNPFIHPSVIFRKKAVRELGGYNPKFRHVEDYELWSRLMKRHPADNLPLFLIQYRILPQSVTRQFNFRMRWGGLKVRLKYLFS